MDRYVEWYVDKSDACFLLFVAIVLGFAVALLLGWSSHLWDSLNLMRAEAIELGHAHHNSVSGDWEWIKTETIKEGE